MFKLTTVDHQTIKFRQYTIGEWKNREAYEASYWDKIRREFPFSTSTDSPSHRFAGVNSSNIRHHRCLSLLNHILHCWNAVLFCTLSDDVHLTCGWICRWRVRWHLHLNCRRIVCSPEIFVLITMCFVSSFVGARIMGGGIVDKVFLLSPWKPTIPNR